MENKKGHSGAIEFNGPLLNQDCDDNFFRFVVLVLGGRAGEGFRGWLSVSYVSRGILRFAVWWCTVKVLILYPARISKRVLYFAAP